MHYAHTHTHTQKKKNAQVPLFHQVTINGNWTKSKTNAVQSMRYTARQKFNFWVTCEIFQREIIISKKS